MGSVDKQFEKRKQSVKVNFEKKQQMLEKELEKRERLIQTYLIVFGLFLSYDKEPSLQISSMKQFLAFIFFALTYYTFLTKYTYYMRSRPEKLLFYGINISSFFCSVIFSYTLVDYIYEVGTGGIGLPFSRTVVILMIIFITWLPLYFSSDLQIQFPETLMLEEMRIIRYHYTSKAKKILNFSIYLILILVFSTIAYIILFVVLKNIDGSSNLNSFKLIMLLLAFGLNLVLFSKIMSIRSNWCSITFSRSTKTIEIFKYDHVISWKQILKKGFFYVAFFTFFIIFFVNISSTEIHMMYMQYKAQSFTDQEITLIYVLYTIISSVLHFEILFAISPQIDNFMRAGRLPNQC